VLVNPFQRADMPPRDARSILERLDEVTSNASVVLDWTGHITADNSRLEGA
jgi:NTE family protein